VRRAAAAVAAFAALALPAAQSGSATSASPAPVLGRDWKTRTLAHYDPVTLARVAGPTVPAGFFTGPWAWSADRSRIVLSRYDWPQLRIVDANRMRLVGDVRLRHLGTAGGVDAVTWIGADRLLALVHGPTSGVAFVVVDAQKRAVLRTVPVAGSNWDAERWRDGLAALLGPANGIGTARVAVARADGTVRTAVLPGVSVGSRKVGKGADPRVHSVIPGFAANPQGAQAVAVTAGSRAISIDLGSMAVTTHVLSQRTTQQVEKAIEGPQRHAGWVGDGLVAVSGTDWSTTASGEVAARGAGLRLIDTAAWTMRTLDTQASAFSVAPGVIVAFGGSWSPSSRTYTGVRAYGLDGALRWSLYEGRDAYAPVQGSFVYVQRYMGANRPEHMDVVDPATGTILGSREWPNGQAQPTLYAW